MWKSFNSTGVKQNRKRENNRIEAAALWKQDGCLLWGNRKGCDRILGRFFRRLFDPALPSRLFFQENLTECLF